MAVHHQEGRLATHVIDTEHFLRIPRCAARKALGTLIFWQNKMYRKSVSLSILQRQKARPVGPQNTVKTKHWKLESREELPPPAGVPHSDTPAAATPSGAHH